MARPANVSDAVEAIEAVRRSIITLCVPDHLNDAATLDRWLANKKPESFAAWISNPDNFCAVEEVDGRVQGLGLLHSSGELRLFYVAPGHERKGLGRSIHEALVSRAAQWGLTKLHLESTSVARNFYESLGYRSTGPKRLMFGVLHAYPYERSVVI
ncbi:MAG TPA: GNAT family N-acetyltransferase [Povalibacter sp.]|nr:GNAT family N-acetyltransferase [Povalibacter sp.]